jgi:hypothetical protein
MAIYQTLSRRIITLPIPNRCVTTSPSSLAHPLVSQEDGRRRCPLLNCRDLYPDPPSDHLRALETNLAKQPRRTLTLESAICLEIKQMARKHITAQQASAQNWPFDIDLSKLFTRVGEIAKRLKMDESLTESPVWAALFGGGVRRLTGAPSMELTLRARLG